MLPQAMMGETSAARLLSMNGDPSNLQM